MKKSKIIFSTLIIFFAAMPGFSQNDGSPLPFLEQWNTGTFETNNWLPEAENWSINGHEGAPSPCAEFTWDPIQSDYSISLESDPFLADFYTEGRIYLDFDIRLDDFSGDGLEQMNVQVWNWDSQVWTTIKTHSNSEGSFDWVSDHIDISSQAMGKVFKLRYNAQGENSLHIVSWFIDNIHVYRKCEGVSELIAECDTILNTIVLYWTGPGNNYINERIHWDDGANSGNAFGTGVAAEFDVAARWEPAHLAPYEGTVITDISFFPDELQCAYNVRIWEGPMAALLVVDLPVPNPVIGQWNYVILTTPLPLDITQELWVGYYVNSQTGYPAGVDDGPAIDGYGNMMNFGEWQTSLEINPEFDYNWNIAAHLVTETGISMSLGKNAKADIDEDQTLSLNPAADGAEQQLTPSTGSRDLIGFNVYRSIDGGDYELLDFISENTYLITEGEPNNGTLYCFMVTAVYESATDQCESDFSNEACVVCGTYITEKEYLIDLKLYPNPARDRLYIESSEGIESVEVFDGRGITIEQWNNGTMDQANEQSGDQAIGHLVELPVNGLPPGLYLVRVVTKGGVVARKVVVGR